MFKKLISFVILAHLVLFSTILLAGHPQNFQEAKKQAQIIWSANPVTIYCGCRYDNHLNVEHQSCGYDPKDCKRANKVEWGHLILASWLGRQRPCWRESLCENKKGKKYKGRKCCEKIDAEYRKMYTDLHNLVPVIGEVNQARNDYRFGEFYPENREQKYNFHGCKIIINSQYRVIEPRDEVKGLIARAHLYMADTYSFKLSKNQERMFVQWNRSFPPSDWEIEWNRNVKEIQGNDNLYITKYAEIRSNRL